MHTNVTIYNELKELNSWLADISNTNVFTVPAGYFDSLSSDILFSINDQSTITELNIGFSDMKVPEGYFDGLADQIMNKIRIDESDLALGEQEPAFLASIRKLNVFTVPEGYFDSLAGAILSKLPQQPARVVEMKPRVSFFKYAAAAAIAGIIGFSLFNTFDNSSNIKVAQTNPIGPVVHVQVDQEVLKKANEILKSNSFDKEVEALNEEDIVRYLKNNGEDVNAALVASVTYEKNLPDEEEYFMDEKTLENFLNEQNIVQTSNN